MICVLLQAKDLLHPLVRFDWVALTYPEVQENSKYRYTCTYLNGKIYASLGEDGNVYSTSMDFASWTPLPPIPKKIWDFSISTYGGKLIAVGGMFNYEGLTQLWVYDEGEWQESLPPMQTGRRGAFVLNINRNPECLLVVGGYGGPLEGIDKIEVFTQNRWWYVEPIPTKYHVIGGVEANISNGNLYVNQSHYVAHCKLDALLATRSCVNIEDSTSEGLWKETHLFVNHIPGSIEEQLYVFELYKKTRRIYAFSTVSQYWVYVADAPFNHFDSLITLPSKEIVMLSRKSALKASMRSECLN